MAIEIARSLEEIDIKVKKLNSTLRESSTETRELDKALRLDSKNTEAAAKKMTALQTAVGTAAQKVALLKQKQVEANKAFKSGDITAAEYKKIELSVIRADNELKRLNNEIVKTQKVKLDQATAGFDKLTSGLNKAQSAAQKLSNITLKIVAALGASVVAFVAVGDEIADVSKKFAISAEHLQTQRFLYSRATNDAKNYDKALSSLNSVMASIAKGRGTAYIETLNKLGISTTDASGNAKSAAVVYEELVTALSTLGANVDIWKIVATEIGVDKINNQEELKKFYSLCVETLDAIGEFYGKEKEINVFSAVCNSLAIIFGRSIFAKSHNTIKVYDAIRKDGIIQDVFSLIIEE